MANKKIEIRPVGDGDFGDVLYPKTSADMVIDEVNGGTLQNHTSDKTQHVYYKDASGTANTYTVSNVVLTSGVGISFKANVTNTGASTLNGISIKNSKGQDVKAGQIVANGIYTVRYNGTAFFLQGAEGGEYGTATAADVIKGTTLGTENGVVNGTLELTGNAITRNVLQGVAFYSNDAKTKLIGTMVNHYGTPTSGTRRSSSSGYIDLSPREGYYNGATDSLTRISDSNFTAANIRSGISMFGLTGTLPFERYARGQAQSTTGSTEWLYINNLGFRPRVVIAKVNGKSATNGFASVYMYSPVVFGDLDFRITDNGVVHTNYSEFLSVNSFKLQVDSINSRLYDWIAFGSADFN